MIGIRIQLPVGYLIYERKAVRAALRMAAAEVVAATRTLVSTSSGSGRVYRGGGGTAKGFRPYRPGRYQASAPGTPPVKVTGTLQKSLKSRLFKRTTGIWIRDAAFYALMLQEGASGGSGSGRAGVKGRRNIRRGGTLVAVRGRRVLAPRPFLSIALDGLADSVGERVRKAVIQGISFREVR